MTTSLTPVNPFGSIIEGLRLGATIEDRELARQKREQEAFAMEKAQEQERIGLMAQQRFVEDPTYENLIGFVPYLNPQAAKVMQESVAAIGKDRARNQLQSIFPAVVAIKKGNPEVANNVLDQIIQGTQNQTSKVQLENLRTLLNADPNYFISTVALTAHESGLPELAKQLLEVGKKQEFRILTLEEQTSLLGPGATGRYGVGPDGKPVQIVPEREGFTALTPTEYQNLGIDPKNAFAQRNDKTGKIDVTKLGPLAEAKATATTSLPPGPKEVLGIDKDEVKGFVDNARVAATFARDVSVIEELLRGKGGGALVALSTRLKEFAGINDDTVTANTLARSVQTRGATQLRAPGSGSTTDFEMRAFLDSFPQLTQTENGRKLLAKYSKKFAERSIKLADYARNLLKDNEYSLQKMRDFDNSLGEIFEDDIKQLIQRPGVQQYPGSAPAAAPVPASAAPPAAAPGRPAAGPSATRRPDDKYRDIGGGFRALRQ